MEMAMGVMMPNEMERKEIGPVLRRKETLCFPQRKLCAHFIFYFKQNQLHKYAKSGTILSRNPLLLYFLSSASGLKKK